MSSAWISSCSGRDGAARIPDLNLTQCQTKYGELPADEYVSLADGMENLVGVLGSLTSHDQDDDSVH
jgi:hypothetical protein